MIFRIRHELLGGHVYCVLFAGPHDGALGKCGEFVVRAAEFNEMVERFDFDYVPAVARRKPRPPEAAADWFTLPPRERTKAKLMEMLR